MKTLLSLIILCALAVSASAQTTPKKHHKKDTNAPPASAEPAQPAPDPAADQAKMVAEYQKSFVPTDPWRVINDHTNFAKGGEWVQFEGRVISSTGDGLIVSGTFGQPLFYMLPGNGGATSGSFVLSNYPRNVGTGAVFSRNDRLVALKSGDKNGMPQLDYGSVYVPQLTEEQKAQLVAAKSSRDEKVLAWHKELAEKGDAYGEYKMGLRYLNGDGVDKDLAKAKDMFSKAAAQGNKDAADELAKISPAN